LQCEVGAAASNTWLGNDDMRRPPSRLGLCWGSASARGKAGVCDWKWELLFAGVFDIDNDDQLRPLASGPLVCCSWVWPAMGSRIYWQLLLPCSATMTLGNVVCLYSAASRGLVSPSNALRYLIGLTFLYINSFVLIER
jgi:hypothetical protein